MGGSTRQREEPASFIASRILDKGYGEMTDLRPVGAGPGFNNGWPRLPDGPVTLVFDLTRHLLVRQVRREQPRLFSIGLPIGGAVRAVPENLLR